jgi:hypothetical protein
MPEPIMTSSSLKRSRVKALKGSIPPVIDPLSFVTL